MSSSTPNNCNEDLATEVTAVFASVAAIYFILDVFSLFQTIRAFRAQLRPLDIHRIFLAPMTCALLCTLTCIRLVNQILVRATFFLGVAVIYNGRCFITGSGDAFEYPGFAIFDCVVDLAFFTTYSIFILFWYCFFAL